MIFAIIFQPMIAELNTLENKVAQVVALCHFLRTENSQLKLALGEAERERKELSERIESARYRLEELARQLPETPDGA